MAYQAALEGENLRKGSWLEEEDQRLTMYVKLKGERRWDALAQESGLRRSGRSCRLRWLNYLRPHLKHGHITVEEEQTILQLHELWGNKWSKIARMLPGRTDNEIKNYWRTHLWKKLQNHDGAVSAGNLQCELDKSKQGIFFEEGDDSNADIKQNFHQHRDSSEKFWTNDAYSDDPGFSDYTLPSSPYETGLSDWISELSSDQSGMAWTPDCDAWDCSSSLWDMN